MQEHNARRLRGIAGLVTGVAACSAMAQAAGNAEPLEEIVVSVTPLSTGSGLAEERIAYHVQTAVSEDIERMQSLHVAEFLNRALESVSVNAAQNNPLQPDIRYRGFTASPLLGLAQGLAVYQDGVRINEPLGDTVNWDLLPQSAIHNLQLIGGANPLFGLNTLGGALSVEMKNGFNAPGHRLDLRGGSFGRRVVSVESGGAVQDFAWYANLHHFDEDGWRDLSPSEADNAYGSLGWRGAASSVNLNLQSGQSELTGNGAVPVELLRRERDAIFTAPDITENDMSLVSVDGSHRLGEDVTFSGNAFYRRNETDSFNGDASEYTVCRLGAADALLEGLDEEALGAAGLEEDDVCGGQFPDAETLERFIETATAASGEGLRIENLAGGLSGSGVLSDAAINNTSTRVQESYGSDVQLTFANELFGRPARSVVGTAWFRGETAFHAKLELAELDPVTRSTQGLGTGTFVDEAETRIRTSTATASVYLTSNIELTERLAVTVSGRFNVTRIRLDDLSGERPELNGRHEFRRLNPAVGLAWQANDHLNLYGSYSESSRTPTPIELACNEAIFERAAAERQEPDERDFECRLPNAFLADPPLEQVTAKSFEAGLRRELENLHLHAGVFHTTNYDDVIFQTTGRATGLFANVDETRRRGVEAGLEGSRAGLDWFLAYSYIEATFGDAFAALSPNHPFADEETGAVPVSAGDRIPGIPKHHLKLGGHYRLTDAAAFGADLLYNSGQFLRGDESNQLEPLDGFVVVNLRGRYRLNEHLAFFASVENLFDAAYESFGLVGEEPSEVGLPAFAQFTDPRFLGPGAPRAVFVGLRLSL